MEVEEVFSLAYREKMEEKGWGEKSVAIGKPVSLTLPMKADTMTARTGILNREIREKDWIVLPFFAWFAYFAVKILPMIRSRKSLKINKSGRTRHPGTGSPSPCA